MGFGLNYVELIFADEATDSLPVDVGESIVVGIAFPANWDGSTSVTFEIFTPLGYQPVYGNDEETLDCLATADTVTYLDPSSTMVLKRFIVTTQTPVGDDIVAYIITRD